MRVMEKVIRKLREIAKRYDLKFTSRMFRPNFVDREYYWPLAFIDGVSLPSLKEFRVYPDTTENRVRVLDKLLARKDYKELKKHTSGCVTSKKQLLKTVKKVRESEMRIRLLKIVRNLKSFNDHTIIITKPVNKIEKIGLNYIMLHEFLHMLLISNKVSLLRIRSNYWKLDEAIVDYLMYEDFIKKNFNKWVLWQTKK